MFTQLCAIFSKKILHETSIRSSYANPSRTKGFYCYLCLCIPILCAISDFSHIFAPSAGDNFERLVVSKNTSNIIIRIMWKSVTSVTNRVVTELIKWKNTCWNTLKLCTRNNRQWKRYQNLYASYAVKHFIRGSH